MNLNRIKWKYSLINGILTGLTGLVIGQKKLFIQNNQIMELFKSLSPFIWILSSTLVSRLFFLFNIQNLFLGFLAGSVLSVINTLLNNSPKMIYLYFEYIDGQLEYYLYAEHILEMIFICIGGLIAGGIAGVILTFILRNHLPEQKGND